LNKEPPVGEIVEVNEDASITVELYDSKISLLKGNLFESFTDDNVTTIYICDRIFKESIDRERRVVALNLSYEEIFSRYPQNKFLIHDYASLYVVGSKESGRFISSVQISNIGIHTRIYPLDETGYEFFVRDEDSLFSMLLNIYNNKKITSAIKPLLNKLLTINNSIEFRTRLYRNLITIFRSDYMLIRDIISSLEKTEI
jgi:hypothetical protein